LPLAVSVEMREGCAVKAFWVCFVPLFVAVDAFGILPLFMSLTEGSRAVVRRQIITQSVLTAMVVTLIFVLAGSALLRVLGITVADFMVAGGALLFILSLTELIAPHRTTQVEGDVLGAVPLGVPLLAGPAVLTTSMLLADQYGRPVTSAAVIANFLLAGLILWFAARIYRVLGTIGTRVLQRVTLLLLAAIAVMTVRKGLESFLH
jgi:multiple antibiotic resistance protein